jgi:hypothetical protein
VGSAALFEFDVPTGGAMHPAQSHHRYEEMIYGVRRTMTWTVDGVTPEVGPKEAVCVATCSGARAALGLQLLCKQTAF